MKLHRKKVLSLLVLLILGSCAVLFYLGWLPFAKRGLKLDYITSITVKKKRLTAKQLKTFQSLAMNLSISSKEIYSKPDFVLMKWTKPTSNNSGKSQTYFKVVKAKSGVKYPDALSIWLNDGFIYEGFYLDAWTARMSGQSSKIYYINGKMKTFLRSTFKIKP